MKRVKKGLGLNGYTAVLPVDPRAKDKIPHDGVLWCKLCRQIHGTDMILAEISKLNRNVLFEAGYAIGAKRCAWFLRSNTKSKSGELTIIRDYETIYYNGSKDIVASFPSSRRANLAHVKARTSEFARALRSWTGEFKPGTAYCILPDDEYHRGDIMEIISAALKEMKIAVLTARGAGHRLFAECRAINEAEFVIGDWVGDETDGAEEKNANAAFLLGFTMALGKKMIILQQKPTRKRMVDMHGVIMEYERDEEIPKLLRQRLGSETLRRTERLEDVVANLVKREFETYVDLKRPMSRENFDFVYKNRACFKPTPAQLAFLQFCANHYGFPKFGFRPTEFQF
ncbi:MAG: hypothetical protein FJ290_22240 [Planctomycetes bacterium]|nr:hypothetical protein [Planctomycetota bacterium]